MLVLYAEDDAIARGLFEMVVAEEPKIDLFMVEDGTQAWDVLQRGLNPDLCVFDINMPGLSGVEVVKKMRSSGNFEHTHVMLLTAANDRQTVLDAAHSNITHYMIKPLDEDVMLNKLRSFLEFLPPPLEVTWLANPRNFIRRQFMTVDTYSAIFRAFFEDVERIMALLARRMDGSNANLLLACVNKINELSVHIGAQQLPEVCAEARKFLTAEDLESHLHAVRLLDQEISSMVKSKPRIIAYLRELKERDILA